MGARLALGFLVLCSCVSGDGARPASTGEPRGTVAFAADLDGQWDFDDGNADIFVMELPAGEPVNLTRNPANDYSPEWSPDGSRIAFRTDRDGNHEIYVMDADGSHPVNLTRSASEDRSPAWSPDGSRIAFSSQRGEERDLFIMEADGSNVVRLHHPGLDEYPTWSPDGSRLAYTSYCPDCSGAALWITNADGTGQQAMGHGAGWPDWSPDGRLIAFDKVAPDGEVAVHAVPPRVGAPARVISPGFQGDWSPDGRYVVLTRDDDTGQLLADLWVVRADGTRARALTRTEGALEFEPTWRPR